MEDVLTLIWGPKKNSSLSDWGELVFQDQSSNSATKQKTEITLPTILKDDIDEKNYSRLCPKEKFYNTYSE